MITIVVADDHAMVRRGIAHLLENEPDFQVVGQAASGEEAVAMCAEVKPTIVVMDLSMPGMDGIESTRRVLENAPDTRVLMLTSFTDRDRIVGALDAGADGFLLKDSEPEDLVAGIHAVARGEAPLHPKAGRALLSARAERAAGEPSQDLTAREREVLALVAAGFPNKRIARELGISEKTVKAHLTSVYRRVGVDDRTQAAIWAQTHGIVG